MTIPFLGGDTLTGIVPKRPTVSAPKFGAWLQLQRGDRSLEQIAKRVRPLVQAVELKVDQSLIYKVEQGRVPNWPLLAALAEVYSVSLGEMTQRLGQAIDFPGKRDLPDHAGDQTSDRPRGETSDVAASAAQARLQQQYDSVLAATTDVAYRLATMLAEHGVDVGIPTHHARTRKGQPRVRKRPRKVS